MRKNAPNQAILTHFCRDDYVRINWENIQPGYYGNFFKYTEEEVTGFGVDYDYDSAMHYSRTGFSINGEDTITPLVRKESREYEWMSQYLSHFNHLHYFRRIPLQRLDSAWSSAWGTKKRSGGCTTARKWNANKLSTVVTDRASFTVLQEYGLTLMKQKPCGARHIVKQNSLTVISGEMHLQISRSSLLSVLVCARSDLDTLVNQILTF